MKAIPEHIKQELLKLIKSYCFIEQDDSPSIGGKVMDAFIDKLSEYGYLLSQEKLPLSSLAPQMNIEYLEKVLYWVRRNYEIDFGEGNHWHDCLDDDETPISDKELAKLYFKENPTSLAPSLSEEENYVPEVKDNDLAPLASHSCASGNSIEEEDEEITRDIDTLYTYFQIDLEDSPTEWDYTICETMEQVCNILKNLDIYMDDDTRDFKATIKGIPMTKAAYDDWCRGNLDEDSIQMISEQEQQRSVANTLNQGVTADNKKSSQQQ